MKIYITGISGSGKSSIARALRAKGITSIDVDEGLCHWENRHTGDTALWSPGGSEEWYSAHGWVCDADALAKHVQANKNIVVVGLSSNQDDYLKLFDKVFVLHCRPETFIDRINARTDNDYGKHEAEQQRMLGWQKTFEKEMKEKGAIMLDAERPLEEVVAEVYSYLDHHSDNF